VSPGLTVLDLGDIADIPDSVRLYGVGHCSRTAGLPVYAYLVEPADGRLVLFDTGCAPPDRAAAAGHPEPAADRYRTAADAVAALGVAPADVGTVVLSHLHWDHCYGLDLFPDATILVQRRELQTAVAPYPEQQTLYESFELGHRPGWLDVLDRVRPLDGWTGLADGVAVVPLPGHTDGSQGLVVDVAGGRTVCCCGDLMSAYESWTGVYRVPGRPSGMIPNGLHSDLAAWRATTESIARSGWVPLPAHDRRAPLAADGRWTPRPGDPSSLDDADRLLGH